MASEEVTRRRLPHWYRPGSAHFITYRLAGSLPASQVVRLRERLRRELKSIPGEGNDAPERREVVHKRAFAEYDRLLHENRRVRHLADARVAAVVANSLRHGDGRWFTLLAYCVMPNHVHAVFVPTEDPSPGAAPHAAAELEAPASGSLTRIMHSLKSYTAHEANRLLDRTGPFWQTESYDHWVRDEGELSRIVEYVVRNPVTAGLTARPEDWPWTWWSRERLS